MKKYIASVAVSLSLALVASAAQAAPTYIADNYWGAGAEGYVNTGTGSPSNFESNGDVHDPFTHGYNLDGMSVDIVDGELQVTIHSTTYFKNWLSGNSMLSSPGDLFLSTNGWNPAGTANSNYGEDKADASTPTTDWNFVINLDKIWEASAVSGDSFLYSIDAGAIETGDPRTAQWSYLDPTNSSDSLAQGAWNYITDNNGDQALFISMSLDALVPHGWDSDQELGLHWTMVTGNDVLEGGYKHSSSSAVPEPGTMMLFGAGLMGLAALGRRRTTKE